jgi:hypothetical protein
VARNCPSKATAQEQSQEIVKHGTVNNNSDKSETSATLSSTPTAKESPLKEAPVKGGDMYGDWLIVNRKKHQGRKPRPNMQGEKANFSGGVVNKPSNRGFLFSHLSENKQLNAEIPIGQEGGPHFHPGGNMDMPKVWTKRNKRARGMDIKGKRYTESCEIGSAHTTAC